jgi:hypothetical protein
MMINGGISSLAFDHVNNIFYWVWDHKLFSAQAGDANPVNLTPFLPVDDYWHVRRLGSVCVDPNNTDILYAAGSADCYQNSASVIQSIDRGKTWRVLTRNNSNSIVTSGPAGGSEGGGVRVNPKTSELWVGTGCFGLWKIGRKNVPVDR